ncbi:threonine synthase [Haloferacaceae archaeon DSL9]
MTTTLRCYDCGRSTADPTAQRCACGEPLWFDTDASAATFDWPAADPRTGIWGYDALLPASPPPSGLGATVGGTPLVRTPALDAFAGVRTYLKDEGRNPTGSFKDRGSAVAVAAALDRDVERVGTVSHGNMAMSTAAHAAGAGLDCVVFVPDDISADRLRNIAQFSPRIVRVDGDYGRLYREALALGRSRDIEFANSDSPLRTAGQKTTGLEICHAFAAAGETTPDAIVVPVSSGGHASATWKAVRELDAAGLLDRVPRLYFVQAAACAPIARAFERGDDAVAPVEKGETVAYSIANPDPPSGARALAAARETGGAILAVDDDEIRTAQQRLAIDAGVSVEASSGTCLAGARRLAERGDLDADETAVLVATGNGFKESIGGVDPDADLVALANLEAVL